ncbi:MAG: aspartate kinase [Bacteroidales bacterium]|nr:aspartate kinase [Bacteroidales bacterium]
MLVFKFGGASVKSADAVKNIVDILKKYPEEIVIVVSAMGKTTNALERIIEHFVNRDEEHLRQEYNLLKEYHMEIMHGLFEDKGNKAYVDIEEVFGDLADRLGEEPTMNYDFDYDQVIGFGEILSTKIIAFYLDHAGLKTKWIDVRKSLKTDNTFREGRIDWELSTRLVKKNFVFNGENFLVTQGFLASNMNNQTVSLGREGSDYTAAILAHMLRAESVTIWKDVPGVLNADPKYFDDTILLDKLSYLDAIELAYYGTSVIHPKTIKPLQNKNINLYVKSFVDPDDPGTLVANLAYEKLVPSFIFKMDQVLIRISPHDFSFIAEDNLEIIYGILHKHGLKINLQQTSAVSFQVIVNNDKRKVRQVVDELEEHFKVSYETGLELVTIRYFDDDTIRRVMINKTLLLEQRGVQNIQLVVRDLG